MNKLWTVLLVLAVAAAAFLLGRGSQHGSAAPAAAPLAPAVVPAEVPVAAPAAVEAATPPVAAADAKNAPNQDPSAQPPQTFRGPDGLPRIIAYEVGVVPDNSDRKAVKAAMLADMKNHPRNVERSYDLSPEDIAAIVAGTKPFPEILLPKPSATPAK